MFRNNLKIAWRKLLKERQFTFLNLFGLSTGLACTFLIYLWVNSEYHVDRFNENDSRLYQVMKNSAGTNDPIVTSAYTPVHLAQSLAEDLPEVEASVATIQRDKGIISYGEKHLKAKHIFAGEDYFKVFPVNLLSGDRNRVLREENEVLISQSLAQKLFNTTENIAGKTIKWDWWTNFSGTFKIAGVFGDLPAGSTMQFDVMFSQSLWVDKDHDNFWGSNNASTYVLLKKGVDGKQFSDKVANYSKAKYKQLYGKESQYEGTIFLQRYSDTYLYNHYENGHVAGGRIAYIRLFSIIGAFILVIACINFTNLTTAKASGRLKEIGVKKVAGARRLTLIFQYLTESVLLSFLSLIIAIVLIFALLPQFNQLTGKHIEIKPDISLAMCIIGITLFTGILAGVYPAFYLSGFTPFKALQGRFKASGNSIIIRKGLVVFQFVLSSAFIVCVFVIYQQMNLIQTKDLGYNRDNMIYFANQQQPGSKIQTFFNELRAIPGVIKASGLSGDLLGNHGGGGGIQWPGQPPGGRIQFSGLYVDYGLIETLGLKMKEGRTFSREFSADTAGSVIFNEEAIAQMHLKNPIGQTVTMWGKKKKIIGVVRNFNFESLYQGVGPFFFDFATSSPNTIVRIKTGTEKETLAKIETLFKTYNQGIPLEYTFMDESYNALYASEQRVSMLSRYFAVITIIISCLGLFGLAAFTAQRRRKEISIRKVIGASTSSLAVMLSKDFLVLVLIALAIAFPAAWWAMHKWLQGFAYHASIGTGIFVLTFIVTIVITLCTIGYQSIIAAIENPVNSLRSE